MPEGPSDERAYQVIIERSTGEPVPLARPGPRAAAPKLSHIVYSWLASEFVDGQDYFRFEPGTPAYNAANWPLGFALGGKTDVETSSYDMLDLRFDWLAKCAVHLPRRYSGLSFRLHPRREGANLAMRNIGNWDGEPQRYREIVSTLARPRRDKMYDLVDQFTYAVTPFCIIGQTWREEYGPFPAHTLDTTIVLFYTFDTFMQECLAIDARRAGVAAADIVAAYRHRYANVAPYPNVLLSDPAALPLARYANPSVDWDLIGATRESVGGTTLPGWQARSARETLFSSRLQTHLMVAIATAFHGVGTFANGHAHSPLLRTMAAPPEIDALAPHWLGHVLGDYDYAAACADLLQSLARHYQQDLSQQLRGMPIPPFRGPADANEQNIAWVSSPLSSRCQEDPIDAFRLNLFEATLDDAAVLRWSEDVRRLAGQ